MSRPDEPAAVAAAIRWGQDCRDVHQGRAAGLFSVSAPLRRAAAGRPEQRAAGGRCVPVVSTPAQGRDALVVVYQRDDRLETAISSWHLACSVCGRLAGSLRAALGPS